VVDEEARPRLLVVDDDVQTARLLARVLEVCGHECAMTHDVTSARQHLAENPVDVVLVDIRLPGESGLDLALELLGSQSGVAVVMVTGVDDPDVAATAIEHGAFGYVIKPFEYNEIVIAVANALRRQRLERSNAAMVAELELLNNTKDTLMASLSHDLRSRLAVILTAADMLSSYRAALSPGESGDMLGCIVSSVEQALGLVEGLLERDRSPVLGGLLDQVDVTRVVRDLVDGLNVDRQVTVSSATVVAPVDEVMVQRIVENLVVNAAKHTPPQSPIEISIIDDTDHDAVIIDVEDHGRGVPEHLKATVFHPFRRGPTSADGMGVGLALVDRFARLHNGRAWVEDRPGGGSIFRVLLGKGGGMQMPRRVGMSPFGVTS
jgi:signal transduction histidine kinase